jgi:hypothetical protein
MTRRQRLRVTRLRPLPLLLPPDSLHKLLTVAFEMRKYGEDEDPNGNEL